MSKDNNADEKIVKQPPTEQEQQAWLDAVHFGSCCSDPIDDQPPSCWLPSDKKVLVDEQ